VLNSTLLTAAGRYEHWLLSTLMALMMGTLYFSNLPS
jgi:hypothetical protein